MKAKRFALVFPLTTIVGVGLWWCISPVVTEPKQIEQVPMPTKANNLKLLIPAHQVELPKMAAVPAKEEPKTDASPVSADPQTDLRTAIPDIARMIRAENNLNFYLTYTAPDKIDPQIIKRLRAEQAMDAKMSAEYPAGLLSGNRIAEVVAGAYEALENQVPIYNSTGDEAVYQITLPANTDIQTGIFSGAGPQEPITFVKINGKWYIEPIMN